MNEIITIPDILTILKSSKSFYIFDNNMVPCEISIRDLIDVSRFISPQIILIHGSYVTKVRYSPEGDPDFDLIIASSKISFWSMRHLYKEVLYRFQKLSPTIKFDISLASPYDVLNHVYNKTSLGQSITQGFTILYPGRDRCR
jgi:hypothetical protein